MQDRTERRGAQELGGAPPPLAAGARGASGRRVEPPAPRAAQHSPPPLQRSAPARALAQRACARAPRVAPRRGCGGFFGDLRDLLDRPLLHRGDDVFAHNCYHD